MMLRPQWRHAIAAFVLSQGLGGCGATPGADGASSGSGSAPDATAPDGGDASAGGAYGNPSSGDGPVLDPFSGQGDACSPAAACPSGFQCGHYADPCTGDVLLCGAACPSGQVCAPDVAGDSQICQPKVCTGRCGVIGLDSCGVAITCGGCSAGHDCVENACVPSVSGGSSDAGKCAPLTCSPDAQTHLCGTLSDGCGHTMACSCMSGQSCFGGVCTAPARECTAADGGALCGSVENACGSGSVACGSCASGSQCVKGSCADCAAPSCDNTLCGKVTNACGQSVTCGSCQTGEQCYEGSCCTPSTCADPPADAGADAGCDPVNLGCGVMKSCSPCPTGEVCTNHKCEVCVPKTCADFDDAGCGHSDGCGKTLSCCAQGTTCQGSICCAPGEVAYNGSCCQPACDVTRPPGAQVSCGQVIYCAPGESGPPH